FAEVRDDPPDSCVDQCEDMLTGSCVGTLRNRQIGDASVEWRRYAAVVEVVLRRVDGGLFARQLFYERLERCYTVRRLLHLLMTLLDDRFGLFVLRLCGQKACLGQRDLRLGLVRRL